MTSTPTFLPVMIRHQSSSLLQRNKTMEDPVAQTRDLVTIVPLSLITISVLTSALVVFCCALLVRDNYRFNVLSSTRTFNLVMPNNTHSGRHDLMDHSSNTTKKEVSGTRANM